MAEDRAHVLAALESLAPPELAESWDNVGVIVDAGRADTVARVFLTVDLTPLTFEEAVLAHADLVLAYHPPIFAGFKRLRRSVPGEALILEAIERGITIYSPHTALDAAAGGMAEWLSLACGPGHARPIAATPGDPQLGAGRVITLESPLSLPEAAARIKAHLGLERVRIAAPEPAVLVRSMAVCPGAGGALFQALGQVDLLLTGEMRHHDILARTTTGTAVVLTDHSNCERGYLPVLAGRLLAACPGLEVVVSRLDADPLRIV